MKKAQIQEIQEKLRFVQPMSESEQPPADSSGMVEVFPRQSNPSAVGRSPSEWGVALKPLEPQSPYRTTELSPTVLEPGLSRGDRKATSATAISTTQFSATQTVPQPRVISPSQSRTTESMQTVQPTARKPIQQFQPVQLSPAPADLRSPQSSPRRDQPRMDHQVAEAKRRMETHLEQINQLAIAQETALLELKKMERELSVMGLRGQAPGGAPGLPRLEWEAIAVPHVTRKDDNAIVMTARSVDFFQAEREAIAVADSLRGQRTATSGHYRSRSANSHPAKGAIFWLKRLLAMLLKGSQGFSPPAAQGRSHRLTTPSFGELEPPIPFTVQEGLVWFIGAIAARIALNLMLASFPGLWLPIVGVVVLPAGIAVYRATTAPQSGFVWGCRLFCIMLGLLLGGRLI